MKLFKKQRKQIAFDLDTNELKREFTTTNYTRGYKLIEKFFDKKGFTKIQSSVYNSNEKMSKPSMVFLLLDLKKNEPWVKTCFKKISITNVKGMSNFEKLLKL